MNKQLTAKLQYALDGLSLSKEQKQALIDVFAEIGNNSGGSGQSDTVYVDLISEYEKPPIIKINNYEIQQSEFTIVSDEDTGDIKIEIHNEELYHQLKFWYYTKCKFVLTEYNETLDFNLVRPGSNTYPTLFGYYDGIKPYFSIGYKLNETFAIIVYEH